jgi:ApaG protein
MVQHGPSFQSEARTRDIRVSVRSAYVPGRSHPARRAWHFSYTVTISNEGGDTVQLLSRRWVITDAHGHVEVVAGPGVVGQQPVLRPGETHTYSSACPLPTEFGTMEGRFRMVTSSGESYDAVVAPFRLAVPEAVQ